MKVNFFFGWQIGLMIDVGINYEKRKYICFEFPFVTIQILGFKPNKTLMKRI